MAHRGTTPSITSTLSLSMSTRLRTFLTCSPSGVPAYRLTATLFFSQESSTPKATLSWWRVSGRSLWPHGQNEFQGLNLSEMLERLKQDRIQLVLFPCYRAANWIRVGQTSGRGRMDREHKADGQAVKDIISTFTR